MCTQNKTALGEKAWLIGFLFNERVNVRFMVQMAKFRE